MDVETLKELIIDYSADVLLLAGYCVAFYKSVKTLIKNVNVNTIKTDVESIKDINKQLLQENLELKQETRELMEAIKGCNIKQK